MSIRGSATIIIAVGLLVITFGTVGLLATRHSAPALRPPPIGVDTVPAPTGPMLRPAADQPRSGQSRSGRSRSPRRTKRAPIARPVSLTIPLIGVKTTLVKLGLAASGALQVPSTAAVAGWYTGSPRPGAIGSAIIAGHIDSLTGPGVFYRLSELTAGDRIYVRRTDATIVEFRVTSVQSYLKDYFPTDEVYGPTPDPELRLITCGGTFDYVTGHYLSNTVVYATEVS